MIDKIANYIGSLLYEHDCVIVPGLGGFIANYREADVDHTQGTIHPPSKEITFNPDLQVNDGLLINHISRKEHISYTEARDFVEEFARHCTGVLNRNEILALPEVGKLYRDPENKLQFIPESTNFLIDSFGLPKVQFFPLMRAETKEEKISLIKDAFQEDVKKKEEKKRRPLWVPLAITAGILLLLAIPITMNWPLKSSNDGPKSAEQAEKKKQTNEGLAGLLDSGDTVNRNNEDNSENNVEEAGLTTDNTKPENSDEANIDDSGSSTTDDTVNETNEGSSDHSDSSVDDSSPNNTPDEGTSNTVEDNTNDVEDGSTNESSTEPANENIEEPIVEDTSTEEETRRIETAGTKEYIIVVGCFGVKSNAENLASKIRAEGYEVDMGKRGSLDRVGVKIRCAPSELSGQLRDVRNKFSSGAWVL